NKDPWPSTIQSGSLNEELRKVHAETRGVAVGLLEQLPSWLQLPEAAAWLLEEPSGWNFDPLASVFIIKSSFSLLHHQNFSTTLEDEFPPPLSLQKDLKTFAISRNISQEHQGRCRVSFSVGKKLVVDSRLKGTGVLEMNGEVVERAEPHIGSLQCGTKPLMPSRLLASPYLFISFFKWRFRELNLEDLFSLSSTTDVEDK
nr:NADH dehydrogenase subunit 7, mitochondrial [Tanacetum cinerariifolium]